MCCIMVTNKTTDNPQNYVQMDDNNNLQICLIFIVIIIFIF
jgi:hypothetical protein